MHKGLDFIDRDYQNEVPKEILQSEKKNIIFLDIDGVIQPYENKYRFYHSFEKTLDLLKKKYPAKYIDEGDKFDICAAYYDWDEIAMGRILYLCRHTGSYIVLHSAWIKYSSLERFKVFFDFYGLSDYLLDKCECIEDSNMRVSRKQYGYYVDEKVIEINRWLDKHNNEVENYVVIDDLDMSWEFGTHFIYTRNILSSNDAFIAKSMLLGYEIEEKEPGRIQHYDYYAIYRIYEVGNKKGVFYRTGYSHYLSDWIWNDISFVYRLFFMFFLNKYCCIKRNDEYKDIGFVCWCIPHTDNEAIKMKRKEIISGLRAPHLGYKNFSLVVKQAKNEKTFSWFGDRTTEEIKIFTTAEQFLDETEEKDEFFPDKNEII